MVRLLISGCNGKMGLAVGRVARDTEGFVIAGGIDLNTSLSAGYPVFDTPSAFNGAADVIIDFSHPSALDGILNLATSRGIPIVVATTGLSAEQVQRIHAAAETVPVFYSANMSLGINLLLDLVKKAAAVLQDKFDIEIIEKHHNQKLDAPSGTALMIADALSEVLDQQPHYVYDRHSQRKKRDRGEIGIHAVRGGTIVGEHEVLFAGLDEVVTVSHTATSKEVFATGAVSAARFLVSQKPGLYTMSELIASL